VRPKRLGDLILDPHDGIERSHRLLEDGAHVAAPHVAPFRLVQGKQVDPAEIDRAGEHLDPARQEPDGRKRRHGLARSGFTDDAERLARIDGERQVLDRIGAVGELGQPEAQALDRQDGGGTCHPVLLAYAAERT
jgi:hypothetical protein